MRIVSDSNIFTAMPSLANAEELQLIPGRDISRKHLLNADALLVRSVTPVNEDLLHGTPVKFVGSATSGTDHVDLEYLRSANIHFAGAPGSNANAVVEYCFIALAYAVLQKNLQIERCKVGLIGAGHVGGLFARKLDKLGIDYRVCDPPLQKSIGLETALPSVRVIADSQLGTRSIPPVSRLCQLEDLLQCDVISLHVPLIMEGEFPTYKLIGERELRQVKPDVILINTCRGTVVHEPDLIRKLRSNDGMTYISDVWDNEPNISAELVALAAIASPHIAGYSQEAKQAATSMLLRALSEYFEQPAFDLQQPLSPAVNPKRILAKTSNAHWSYLLELLPLLKLSEELKQATGKENAGILFDAMRKRQLNRREFQFFSISAGTLTTTQQLFLQTQGLRIS